MDDLLEVRGLSATLPPNEPKDLDLEVRLAGRVYQFRLSQLDDGWKVKKYHRMPEGTQRGTSGPHDELADAVFEALRDPLWARMFRAEIASYERGRKQRDDPASLQEVQSPDEIFGPKVSIPKPPAMPLPSRAPDDSRFLRLVPGPDRAVSYAGGHLRVLMVELYEEGIAVSWHVSSVPKMRVDEPDEHGRYQSTVQSPRWVVTDNRRRRYRCIGGGMRWGRHHVHGRFLFTPGVDPEARRLNVTINGNRFTVDLAAS